MYEAVSVTDVKFVVGVAVVVVESVSSLVFFVDEAVVERELFCLGGIGVEKSDATEGGVIVTAVEEECLSSCTGADVFMSRASRRSVVTLALMSLMPTIALASSTAQCPVSASA
jgi:hypothetical protein